MLTKGTDPGRFVGVTVQISILHAVLKYSFSLRQEVHLNLSLEKTLITFVETGHGSASAISALTGPR